ncbi:MAG: hypothetical protein Ct9H300mP11_07490 [Chloroflexota bacterium]|nr:MAG: hypothetical protein Ct9H300mP11_07490 [Chloroflexota bacterium]
MIVTWNTMGMRGTASNDAEYTKLFVPENHTYSGLSQGFTIILYTIRRRQFYAVGPLFPANALGMARGAMDAFKSIATAGRPIRPIYYATALQFRQLSGSVKR